MSGNSSWHNKMERMVHCPNYTPVQALKVCEPIRRTHYCRFLINTDMVYHYYKWCKICWLDGNHYWQLTFLEFFLPQFLDGVTFENFLWGNAHYCRGIQKCLDRLFEATRLRGQQEFRIWCRAFYSHIGLSVKVTSANRGRFEAWNSVSHPTDRNTILLRATVQEMCRTLRACIRNNER